MPSDPPARKTFSGPAGSARMPRMSTVQLSAKAIQAMVDLVEHDIAGKTPVRISVFHANAPEIAQQLQDKIVKQFNAVEGILSWVSPVVGSHVGPGTLSIAYQAGL